MTYATVENRSRLDYLYRQHSRWLNGWLQRKSYRVSSSEDIASEVFLRLMTLPALHDLREPRAMMTTIAKRVIFELRRKNDLWQVCEAEINALPDHFAPSPEEQLLVMETLRRIDLMLGTLKPKARAAFLYCKVDGMKQEAIAKKLDISLATVERYVSQGLRGALALKSENR